MVWPFKDYKIVEDKEFSCKGVKGFAFNYPVFKDWPVKEAKEDKQNPGRCVINFEESGTTPMYIEVNKFSQGTKSETDESVLRGPTKNAKINPNGVKYDHFEGKDFGVWYEFYDDYKSVSVRLMFPKNYKTFSAEVFWKKIVETFTWDK